MLNSNHKSRMFSLNEKHLREYHKVVPLCAGQNGTNTMVSTKPCYSHSRLRLWIHNKLVFTPAKSNVIYIHTILQLVGYVLRKAAGREGRRRPRGSLPQASTTTTSEEWFLDLPKPSSSAVCRQEASTCRLRPAVITKICSP